MSSLGEHLQQADWKKEKHVPVIEAPTQVSTGELFEVKVSIGKEVAHPNTTEHHINWITLYFQPQGNKFTHQLGHYEFSAHGESTAGANQGPAYTEPIVVTSIKLTTPGTFYALALCNIHGLWESSQEIAVNA